MGTDAERTNLVGSHCKGMNVRRFRRITVWLADPPWVYLFWRHISDNAPPAHCCLALRLDLGIRDNRRDLKISNARSAVVSNQNVSLGPETT